MTTRVSTRERRTAVSLSDTSTEPVEQLDRVVEILHQVNQALPKKAPDREELIALAGLFTQISGALQTLTDQIATSTHSSDRIRIGERDPHASPAVPVPGSIDLLRDRFLAAHACARRCHANLRRP